MKKSLWGMICAACVLGGALIWGANQVPLADRVAETLSGGSSAGDSVPAGAVFPASDDAIPGESAADALSLSALAPAPQGTFRRVHDEIPPDVGAVNFLVGDPISGTVFAERSGDARWPIASITKLVTAVAADEMIPATTTVSVGEDDVARVADAGTGTLAAGSSYAAWDLIRTMLVVSSNEAAEALADHDDRSAFLARMNAIAAGWGLSNTYFADPTGLSVANQSTPRDLMRLAGRLVSDHADLLRVTRTPKVAIRNQASGKNLSLQNINQFAGQAGFVGGKTGFIEDSQGNLLSVFTQGGAPVIVVVLGSADRFTDTETLIRWFRANFAAGS